MCMGRKRQHFARSRAIVLGHARDVLQTECGQPFVRAVFVLLVGRTMQRTLFGTVAQKAIIVYKNPSNDYEKFVNKYAEKHPSLKKADVVENATAEWTATYKHDASALCEYLTSSIANPAAVDFGFRKVDSPQPAPPLMGRAPIATHLERSSSAFRSSSESPLSLEVGALATNEGEVKRVFELAAVVSLLDAIGVDSEDFLTEDVVALDIFMCGLNVVASDYKQYRKLNEQYNSLLSRGAYKGSKLAKMVGEVDDQMKEGAKLLRRAGEINIGQGAMLMQSTVAKGKLLLESLAFFSALQPKFSDVIGRLQVRIAQMRQDSDGSKLACQISLQCQNTLNLPWEMALVNVTDALINQDHIPGPLGAADIIMCGQVLRHTNALLANLLPICAQGGKEPRATATVLQQWLPIMTLVYEDQIVLINIHELVLSAQSLTDLLCLGDDLASPTNLPTESASVDGIGEISDSSGAASSQAHTARSRKPGPAKGDGGAPARHIQYPIFCQNVLVAEATLFIRSHSFSAQSRRRTGTATSLGVTLQQLRDHLLKTVPGLASAGISRSTVHRLMLPPRKGTTAAKSYKGLIQARVPAKQNTATAKEHAHLHYTQAQVQYVNEIFQFFGCTRISADDKNKVNVGTPAVSRYHQISAFFMVDDAPNQLDHDFPYANSKLIPSGYLVMQSKATSSRSTVRDMRRARSLSPGQRTKPMSRRSRSVSPVGDEDVHIKTIDKLGRLHISYPCTGELYVLSRAGRFKTSAAISHC